MNIAQLVNQPQKKPIIQLPDVIKYIRLVCRLVSQVMNRRNDTKMIAWFSRTQIMLSDTEVFKISRESLNIWDDFEALGDYLVPVYQYWISSHYDPLLHQAISEDITWFVYPLFDEIWLKFGNTPDKVVEIFQNWTQVLNLLGKDTFFNQMHESDSPIFLIDDRIEATEELKRAKIGKVGWCPMMRVKSAIKWTLMTDFMITCVKFWIYRRVLQGQH